METMKSPAPRTPLHLEVVFRRNYARTDTAGVLKNISLSGAFLELESHDFRQDEKVNLTFVVGSRERKISAQIPLALLSNAASEEVRPRLQSCGIAPLFKEVLISAEIGRAKPDPEIFLLCCKRLGLAPQSCLFIDDRSANVIAAKQLGMQTILFKNSPGLQSKISKYCPSLMLDFDQ
jgi:FMN phosphatase YigB (HAD superfamily)